MPIAPLTMGLFARYSISYIYRFTNLTSEYFHDLLDGQFMVTEPLILEEDLKSAADATTSARQIYPDGAGGPRTWRFSADEHPKDAANRRFFLL